MLAVNFNQLQGSSGEENECEENIFDLVLPPKPPLKIKPCLLDGYVLVPMCI